MLVRPAWMIRMSFANCSATLACPTRRPSPAATISVMDTMPQAMPNMVRAVRSLCAESVRRVSRSRSRKVTVVSGAWRYCRTTWSPSLSPVAVSTSAFTPFVIPNVAGTRRRPPSCLASGTSRNVFFSLS